MVGTNRVIGEILGWIFLSTQHHELAVDTFHASLLGHRLFAKPLVSITKSEANQTPGRYLATA